MMKKIYLFVLILLFSGSLYADCQQEKAYYEQAKAYYEQAIANKKNKKYQQALNDFQQSAQLCPRFGVYFEQGKTLAKLKRFDEALASYKKAGAFIEEGSEEKINLLANMAIVYLKKGSLQQASLYAEQSYDIKKQSSPERIIKLRRHIDLKNAGHVVSAQEIMQTLIARKSFGVAPKIKFNSITFKFDSTELTAQGQQQVIELNEVLVKSLQGSKQALLIGHTDKKGDAAYNMSLSRRRAEAVKRVLVEQNPALRNALQTQGKGEQELRYIGNDATDHQLNRRVELQLL